MARARRRADFARVRGELPTYVMDRGDRIVRDNKAFDRLAVMHGRPDLGAPVVGRSLPEFIAGTEVRHLWRTLLDRARDCPMPLRLHYRCDAPEMARLAVMELSQAGNDGEVELRSHFTSVAPRLPQRLFDVAAERDERMLRSCAWCNRFDLGGRWLEVELAVEQLGLMHAETVPAVTHTICERCVDYLDDPSPDFAPDPPL
jgi:hypothetical protein